MTAPRDRQAGLERALAEFAELLARWQRDEEQVDIDDLSDLPVYRKETQR